MRDGDRGNERRDEPISEAAAMDSVHTSHRSLGGAGHRIRNLRRPLRHDLAISPPSSSIIPWRIFKERRPTT
jgi:hypothetical protein